MGPVEFVVSFLRRLVHRGDENGGCPPHSRRTLIYPDHRRTEPGCRRLLPPGEDTRGVSYVERCDCRAGHHRCRVPCPLGQIWTGDETACIHSVTVDIRLTHAALRRGGGIQRHAALSGDTGVRPGRIVGRNHRRGITKRNKVDTHEHKRNGLQDVSDGVRIPRDQFIFHRNRNHDGMRLELP